MKQIINLENWNFKIDSLNFEKQVALPHTWNVDDNVQVQLYRGKAKYSTQVEISSLKNKTAVLYFGCAFHTAEIFVNGDLAGVHKGSGYTPFEFDITEYLNEGKNNIRVTVDNYKCDEMLPHALDYDWADDGGLTRNVVLTVFDRSDLLDMQVTYSIKNMTDSLCDGVMRISVKSIPQTAEIEVIDFKTSETVISKSVFIDGAVSLPFENLKLWDINNPNLYLIKVKTKDDAALHGDIAMWNEYLGLWLPCKNVKKTIIETHNRCGNMPSMVTEFGLCEPHFKGGDERRTEILLERIPIYKSLSNMVGYVWFSLNDYRTHCGEAGEGKFKQRIHGSTDLYANEKPSYEVFKNIE